MSEYPEHDKQSAAIEAGSQTVGEFMEWLVEVKRLELGHWVDGEHASRARFAPAGIPIQTLLAEFFEIDLDKIEQERRLMLDHQRNVNAVMS